MPRDRGELATRLERQPQFPGDQLAVISGPPISYVRRNATGRGVTRGYAIALGAGTQVFTMLPWVLIFGLIGAPDEVPRTVLMEARHAADRGSTA